MKLLQFAVWAPLLALVGCGQKPVQPVPPQPKQPAAKALAPKARVAGRPPATPRALPNQELSKALLFKLLVAEIASQRGQANVAVQSFLELARETKDPRVAQRATEV